MQQSIAIDHINAERFTVPVGTTVNLSAYINGVIQQHCSTVIAIGAEPATQAKAAAEANPSQHFVLVNTTLTGENIAVVRATTPSEITSETKTLIAKAVRGVPLS